MLACAMPLATESTKTSASINTVLHRSASQGVTQPLPTSDPPHDAQTTTPADPSYQPLLNISCAGRASTAVSDYQRGYRRAPLPGAGSSHAKARISSRLVGTRPWTTQARESTLKVLRSLCGRAVGEPAARCACLAEGSPLSDVLLTIARRGGALARWACPAR